MTELAFPLPPDVGYRLLAKAMLRARRSLGGPGSGNFGHAGRPGQVGGSASDTGSPSGKETSSDREETAEEIVERLSRKKKGELDINEFVALNLAKYEVKRKAKGLLLYHGTADDVADAILSEGLIPRASAGADSTSDTGVIRDYSIGGQKASVFMSSDEDTAVEYAGIAQEYRGGKPVIFEIRVPKEHTKKVLHDTDSIEEHSAVRIEGKIPKEWITRIGKVSGSGGVKWRKLEEFGASVYAVLFLDELDRALGGPGSGHFGHAGRPGEVGGSATAGFRPANPGEAKALGLPPAWTDVKVNPDPDGALIATGVDKKGRTQYRYSAKHRETKDAAKFERMKDFEEKLPSLRKAVQRDLRSKDEEVRDAAAVVDLIDKTGFRIGSDSDTLADKKAYGATTLQARHVKVKGDIVEFNFTAKKGTLVSKKVKDPDLAKQMTERLEGKSRSDNLFSVSDADVRDYMSLNAEGFTPKDFRTRHATALAFSLVKSQKDVPGTKAEFKKARKWVGDEVAKFLGNTHTVALASYIDPAVFAGWEAKDGR